MNTAAVLLSALALVGQADGGPRASAAQTQPLRLYSSLPLHGPARSSSVDVIRAIRLALRDHGFSAGGHRIEYVSLDDSTAASRGWDAAQTKANARHVAQDERAIAYIGELNSGATANSLPTLNEADILQVSPANTYVGLTRDGPGTGPGEPDIYYPTGARTYGRVIPNDRFQGVAQSALMRRDRLRSLYVLHDREVYGRGVAAFTRAAARRHGIAIAGSASWNGGARGYRALARRVRASGADGVFAGGIVDNNAARLLRHLHRARPGMRLYAPDAMATDELARRLPRGVEARLRLTAPFVPRRELPAAGRRFHRRFAARFGTPVDRIDPYAVYGYAAADAVLDAIDRAAGRRRATINAFFGIRDRPSVLGRFSIDKHGDTTLRLFGAYRLRGDRLVFDRALRP